MSDDLHNEALDGEIEQTAPPAENTGDQQNATPADNGDAQEKQENAADENQTVPLKAHAELRKKRREAEERAAELERKLARFEGKLEAMQQVDQTDSEPVDTDAEFWDDPSSYIKEQTKAVAENLQASYLRQSIADNVDNLIEGKDDGQESIQAFRDAVTNDPAMYAEFETIAQQKGGRAAAMHAYKKGSAIKKFGHQPDIEAIKQQAIEQYKKTLENPQGDPSVQNKQQLPRSQAGIGSAGANKSATDTPNNLDGVFGNFQRLRK